MRRIVLAVGALALVSAVYIALRYDTREANADEGVTIAFEAEDAKADLQAPFARKTGTRYDKQPRKQKNSGAGYLEIPDKANGNKKEETGDLPGKATFKVKVPKAGQYTVWARTMWPNGCGNSFWVRQDGRPNQLLGEDASYDAWKWRKVTSTKFTLAAGTNIIIVGNREDGVLLDQVLLTTTSTVPAGPRTPTAGALVD